MTHNILEYKHRPVGTLSTTRLPPHGIEVWNAPDKDLDGDHYLFLDLARIFNEGRILYKIYPDGRVFFLAPFGVKYGRLLGEVARVYYLLQRMEAHQ